MSGLSGKALREYWIAKAERLDKSGHFAHYPTERRDEILRKGFLGQYPPDKAIEIARGQVQQGHEYRTPKFIDEMREHFRVAGEEVRGKTLQVLDEIPPETYEPPLELDEPPGCPFVYRSTVLACEIYFKFQITGTPKKPRVLLWSCHPPFYGSKTK